MHFRQERQDLVVWAVLTASGSASPGWRCAAERQLGTRSAPFLGSYRFALGPRQRARAGRRRGRCSWRRARPGSTGCRSAPSSRVGWLGAFAWALALALVDGAAGLTRSLRSPDNYLADVPHVGDDPLAFLRDFTADATEHSSAAARGHPPGPVLLLWALQRLGFTDRCRSACC